jgi:hypothetical protein
MQIVPPNLVARMACLDRVDAYNSVRPGDAGHLDGHQAYGAESEDGALIPQPLVIRCEVNRHAESKRVGTPITCS